MLDQIEECGNFSVGTFGVFISHGPSDWRYKGRYCVAHRGATPRGAFVDTPNTNADSTSIVQAILAGHKKGKGDWHRKIQRSWNVRVSSVELGMDDLRRDEEATIQFVVLTCVGWDDTSLRERKGEPPASDDGTVEVMDGEEGEGEGAGPPSKEGEEDEAEDEVDSGSGGSAGLAGGARAEDSTGGSAAGEA